MSQYCTRIFSHKFSLLLFIYWWKNHCLLHNAHCWFLFLHFFFLTLFSQSFAFGLTHVRCHNDVAHRTQLIFSLYTYHNFFFFFFWLSSSKAWRSIKIWISSTLQGEFCSLIRYFPFIAWPTYWIIPSEKMYISQLLSSSSFFSVCLIRWTRIVSSMVLKSFEDLILTQQHVLAVPGRDHYWISRFPPRSWCDVATYKYVCLFMMGMLLRFPITFLRWRSAIRKARAKTFSIWVIL